MVYQLIECFYCESQVAGVEEALREGWRGIERDYCPEFGTWSHLGVCPDCLAARGDELGDLLPVISY